jgi:hypothetical protein
MHRIVAMVFAPLKRNGQIFVEDLTNIFCTKFGLVISDEMIFKVSVNQKQTQLIPFVGSHSSYNFLCPKDNSCTKSLTIPKW